MMVEAINFFKSGFGRNSVGQSCVLHVEMRSTTSEELRCLRRSTTGRIWQFHMQVHFIH